MRIRAIIAVLVCILASGAARAHFQVLIPSRECVDTPSDRVVELDLRFSHPMENGPVMEMGIPKQFGVLVRGQRHDLLPALEEKTVNGKRTFTARYEVESPGAHVFYLEPAPYWESAEKTMIIHYTKVVVAAFGSWSGWDASAGFPVEIEPLTRPYGLWTGNVFQGIVKKDGQPVPFVPVEIEFLNDLEKIDLPSDAYVTQIVRSDANGVFTYAMPKAGWWGFAALVPNGDTMPGPNGEEAEVELGAVIWVRTVDMKDKAAGSADN